MTYREKFKLQFVWETSAYYTVVPRVRAMRTHSETLIGGAPSYYLADLIDYYTQHDSIRDLLQDAQLAAAAGTGYVNDEYSTDYGRYVGIASTEFIIGDVPDADSPENVVIPLADFHGLLLEWRAFISKGGRLLKLPFTEAVHTLVCRFLHRLGILS